MDFELEWNNSLLLFFFFFVSIDFPEKKTIQEERYVNWDRNLYRYSVSAAYFARRLSRK